MTKTTINPKLDEILSVDPIAQVSEVFGKHHDSFSKEEQFLSLIHGMAINKQKSNVLRGLGDTHFGIKWNDFLSLLTSYGFVDGYSYEFEYDDFDGEVKKEMAILYYHPEKGLVVWATSYSEQTSLNAGKLYGELRYDKPVERKMVVGYGGSEYEEIVYTDELKEARDALNRCSHSAFMTIDKGLDFSLDVREGLINKLHSLEEHLVFTKVWTRPQFLWFLDFKEEKMPNYDYPELTKEKILKSPPELQNILHLYLDDK